jgi:hypothetical protein
MLLMSPTPDEMQQWNHGLPAQLIHIILHLQAQCHMATRMLTVIKERTVHTILMVLQQSRRNLFSQGTDWTEMVTADPWSTKRWRGMATSDTQGHLILVLAGTMLARKVIINSP